MICEECLVVMGFWKFKVDIKVDMVLIGIFFMLCWEIFFEFNEGDLCEFVVLELVVGCWFVLVLGFL